MTTNKAESPALVNAAERPCNHMTKDKLPEVNLRNIGNTLSLIREIVENDLYSPDSLSDQSWHGLVSLIQATEEAVAYEHERSLNHWAELDEPKGGQGSE